MALIIILVASLLIEIKFSIIKQKQHHISPYFMWLLWCLFVFIMMGISLVIKWEFLFDPSSIYLIICRLVFECLQVYWWLKATTTADRSTATSIKMLTLPLLVTADLFLGYEMSTTSVLWIIIITLAFILFNLKWKTLNFKWSWYAFATAINACITLSFFKYLITHYNNSFEVVQMIAASTTIIFLWAIIYYKKEKASIKLLKDKIVITGLSSYWIWAVMSSYWYTLVTASEATTFVRIWGMFSWLLMWYLMFKEDQIKNKIWLMISLSLWILVMNM